MTRLQPINLLDFTGGLNLRRGEFNLGQNESPEMLNIEVDPRRGFTSRRGWARWNSADIVDDIAEWDPRNGYVQSLSDGTYVVYVANGTTVWASNASASFSDLAVAAEAQNHLADFTSWGDTTYISCGHGTLSYRRLGENTPEPLLDAAGGFNDDYTTPVFGRFPQAELCESHAGYMFVASTYEGAGVQPNRIRWSHPNEPEDWASLDFLDIEVGGGRITALLSFQDHLLIFKTDSVWALYGYNSESWQLIRVSRAAGTPNATSVTASENTVYFYSSVDRGGIFAYTGQQPFEISDPIRTAMEEIDDHEDVWLAWVGRRLWCVLPWVQGAERVGSQTSALVFDPLVGQGAWVLHRAAVGDLSVILERSDIEADYPLALVSGAAAAACVVRLDFQDRAEDRILEDESSTPFDSTYRTGWIDAGYPDRLKSWRRARFILRNPDFDVSIRVEAFANYDSVTPYRTSTVTLDAPSELVLWDGGTLWDDGTEWPLAGAGSRLERTRSFGHREAIQFRFSVAAGTLGAAWGIDAIILKYIFRRFTT